MGREEKKEIYKERKERSPHTGNGRNARARIAPKKRGDPVCARSESPIQPSGRRGRRPKLAALSMLSQTGPVIRMNAYKRGTRKKYAANPKKYAILA